MKQIILASTSPRRRKILSILGVDFKVVPSLVVEKLNPRLKPRHQAEMLSEKKAKAVSVKFPDAVIIAADTIVSLNGDVLGKPKSSDEAGRMLKRLSGKMHKIVTGFTIIHEKNKKIITDSVETKVVFKKLTQREIANYIASQKPFDKAGAYAVQDMGALFVEKIDGDYYAAVGLPLFALCRELKKFGIVFL